MSVLVCHSSVASFSFWWDFPLKSMMMVVMWFGLAPLPCLSSISFWYCGCQWISISSQQYGTDVIENVFKQFYYRVALLLYIVCLYVLFHSQSSKISGADLYPKIMYFMYTENRMPKTHEWNIENKIYRSLNEIIILFCVHTENEIEMRPKQNGIHNSWWQLPLW